MPTALPAPADTTAAPPSGKGVSATWWYTLLSAGSFVLAVLFGWAVPLLVGGAEPWRVLGYLAGAAVWTAVFAVSAQHYRRADGEAPQVGARAVGARALGVAALGVAGAAATGLATGSTTLPLSLVFVLVGLLPWPRGVRWRVTVLLTALLLLSAWLEFERVTGDAPLSLAPEAAPVLFAFAIGLPFSIVSMLWWWDIVRELDRARLAEGRLAAAQERLILAGDVHDLQGHHLQVIALQLELAERLLRDDPDGALEQLRAAQRSVDGARTGTRELATRFRSVSLADELANAADLLRSAGLRVELAVDPDADRAPADVLGPVIRESTTNILKHGGGESARLRLAREAGSWRFQAVNDVPEGAEAAAIGGSGATGSSGGTRSTGGTGGTGGSGVVGMTERIERAGGTLRARTVRRSFELDARVPGGAA
ncbi:sensor histidine kinase [Rathayibacter sp. VKM Ac-2856]|uniref:sensor histidine kinase n=1 Tax=unclassified Rathayibacter TaxID=2609250 RepID=UPI001563B5E0|nr:MULTISPECIES: histidine kinase [unclassified Rathayibacter]NQX05971.1 sensor histidine kinase [Rathayibacter sp. VKM Ac-2858]NQX21079.1 sensor histidine kinase [Rathayibacter sp. VKM Ac-2856]